MNFSLLVSPISRAYVCLALLFFLSNTHSWSSWFPISAFRPYESCVLVLWMLYTGYRNYVGGTLFVALATLAGFVFLCFLTVIALLQSAEQSGGDSTGWVSLSLI